VAPQVWIMPPRRSLSSVWMLPVIPVQDNQWSYLPEINLPGSYSLSLEARDKAGNLTSLGSWTLEVVDSFKLWLPILLR